MGHRGSQAVLRTINYLINYLQLFAVVILLNRVYCNRGQLVNCFDDDVRH
jgi:hypothetical protein